MTYAVLRSFARRVYGGRRSSLALAIGSSTAILTVVDPAAAIAASPPTRIGLVRIYESTQRTRPARMRRRECRRLAARRAGFEALAPSAAPVSRCSAPPVPRRLVGALSSALLRGHRLRQRVAVFEPTSICRLPTRRWARVPRGVGNPPAPRHFPSARLLARDSSRRSNGVGRRVNLNAARPSSPVMPAVHRLAEAGWARRVCIPSRIADVEGRCFRQFALIASSHRASMRRPRANLKPPPAAEKPSA